MWVVFLYYEDTWQETALQLVAAKLKAALLVDGDLAEGLAAMEVDDGKLMDALMKAVSQGRPSRVEWSGMEIAAVAKSRPILQPTPSADHPQWVETEVDIVQVDVGSGATQISWSGLEVATVTKPSRAFRRSKMGEEGAKPKITRVKVIGGGVQLAFL